MKKLFATIFVIGLLAAAMFQFNSISGWFRTGEYSAYGLTKLAAASNVRYRDYKSFTEASADLSAGLAARLTLQRVKGESIVIEKGEKDAGAILEKFGAEVVERQKVGGIDIVYGYTKRLKTSVTVDGKLVNLQIAESNGKITVGTPVILGSY